MSSVSMWVEHPEIIKKLKKDQPHSVANFTKIPVVFLGAFISTEDIITNKFTEPSFRTEKYQFFIEISDELEFSHSESITNSIVYELHRLENGWSGLESIAPSVEIINDVKVLLRVLNFQSNGNLDVQVDDDGSVTVYLQVSEGKTLDFDISGDQSVQCTYVTGKFIETKSEVFKISDYGLIRNFVDTVFNQSEKV